MGLESRDYVRNSPPPGGYGYGGYAPSGDGWAIKYLIIANIAVFILQVATRDPMSNRDPVSDWLSLNLADLKNLQVWRVVTYGFCHAAYNPMHIAMNMFVLWIFGRAIEPIYGSREFLYFYFTGIVIAGLCHVAMQVIQDTPAGVIGASGGVMAVVFLTAMVYPRMKVYLFFVLPIELRILAVLYAAADVLGAFHPSGVAHWAHLGGAAFGVAYKYYGWRITGLLSGWSSPFKGMRRQPKLRVHRPKDEPAPREDLDARVDRLLAKISATGEASLTDEEREFLAEASRRYRSR